IVLGLLGFFYLAAVTLVLSAEFNVVRLEHLYPRAVLAPFTDDVTLTPADRLAYREQAEAERMKSFQAIDVSFDPPPLRPRRRSTPDAPSPADRAPPTAAAPGRSVPT